MTKTFSRAVIACTALLSSSLAWSIPIGTVGALDSLVTSANLGNSGEDTEANWVASILGGGPVTFEDRTECDDSCAWESVSGTTFSDVFAFALTSTPAYYLIKTGNGSSTGNTHFLYQNLGALDYAVVRLSEMGFGSKVTISKVSHVTEFNSVPEPMTLGLFGLGFLGMAFGRKKIG